MMITRLMMIKLSITFMLVSLSIFVIFFSSNKDAFLYAKEDVHFAYELDTLNTKEKNGYVAFSPTKEENQIKAIPNVHSKEKDKDRRAVETEGTVVSEVVRSPLGWDTPSANVNTPSIERLLTYFKYENVSFEEYQLNSHLGQTLPLVRQLPGSKPSKCYQIQHGRKFRNQLKVSVIIPFHNELWAILLRNVHTIFANSPMDILQEIILVDDMSTKDNLKSPLENYVQWLPKIRLLRTKERVGLIRARMAGARQATGNILVFLDAHVEVTKGWLEPLVAVIAEDSKTVAVPYVAQIEPKNLEYWVPGNLLYQISGSFTWELDYLWTAHRSPKNNEHLPYNTSTIIGCGFAVQKNYFFEIGGFDEGLDIWGGENLEISFRTWQCGGSMQIVPCSAIGHVFRTHLPYQCSDDQVMKNLQRVAEVWMDEYKKYFYRTVPKLPTPVSESEELSLSQRKILRRELKCRPFSWYLQNIATDLTPPMSNSYIFGQLKSVSGSMCAYVDGTNHIIFDSCFFNSIDHQFSFTNNNKIQSLQNNFCLSISQDYPGLTVMQQCKKNAIDQLWTFAESPTPIEIQQNLIGVDFRKPVGRILSTSTRLSLCLTVGKFNGVETLLTKPCTLYDQAQYFIFTHRLK